MAFAWLCLVLLAAVLAPVLPLPYPPGIPDLAHVAEPPFGPGRHWLGTDSQGLDVLSELLFGARTALALTLPAAVLAAALGALAGGAAGFWLNSGRLAVPYWLLPIAGGWWLLHLPRAPLVLAAAVLASGSFVVWARWRHRPLPAWPLPLDSFLMGTATALDTLPRLVLVVAMAAITGVAIPGLLVLFVLTSWPHPARLVRAQMLRVRGLPFVEAAQAAGLRPGRVWLWHALPHAVQPLRVALPLSLAGLLGLESTLSFLGVGLPPNVASWGRLLAGIRYAPTAWWIALFPASMLIISTLSLYLLSRTKPSGA
ncbi:ABC transporter permease [Hymenobacter daeguensis]